MPDSTLLAFEDHGTLARTLDADPGGAEQVMTDLAEAGIDMDDVSARLESEGVASFSKSFDEALDNLGERAEAI